METVEQLYFDMKISVISIGDKDTDTTDMSIHLERNGKFWL